MKLPNGEYTVVPWAKVVDYLLSDTHRDGQHKAAFFKRFGFTAAEWERLARALWGHAAEHDVTRAETSPYRMDNGMLLRASYARQTRGIH